MNHYRISKYRPEYRQNGVYIKSEWTSICDVGKTFDGVTLTISEYERVEGNYLLFLRELCRVCGVQTLEIKGLEKYDDDIVWSNGMILRIDQIERICRDILREKCWCRLDAEQMHIDFGYEYYMHIGCELCAEEVCAVAAKCELYVEAWYEESFDED